MSSAPLVRRHELPQQRGALRHEFRVDVSRQRRQPVGQGRELDPRATAELGLDPAARLVLGTDQTSARGLDLLQPFRQLGVQPQVPQQHSAGCRQPLDEVDVDVRDSFTARLGDGQHAQQLIRLSHGCRQVRIGQGRGRVDADRQGLTDVQPLRPRRSRPQLGTDPQPHACRLRPCPVRHQRGQAHQRLGSRLRPAHSCRECTQHVVGRRAATEDQPVGHPLQTSAHRLERHRHECRRRHGQHQVRLVAPADQRTEAHHDRDIGQRDEAGQPCEQQGPADHHVNVEKPVPQDGDRDGDRADDQRDQAQRAAAPTDGPHRTDGDCRHADGEPDEHPLELLALDVTRPAESEDQRDQAGQRGSAEQEIRNPSDRVGNHHHVAECVHDAQQHRGEDERSPPRAASDARAAGRRETSAGSAMTTPAVAGTQAQPTSR